MCVANGYYIGHTALGYALLSVGCCFLTSSLMDCGKGSHGPQLSVPGAQPVGPPELPQVVHQKAATQVLRCQRVGLSADAVINSPFSSECTTLQLLPHPALISCSWSREP